MQNTFILRPFSAAFYAFLLTACGGTKPNAPASPSSPDHAQGVIADADAGETAPSQASVADAGAGESAQAQPPGPPTGAAQAAPVDSCNPASANFEQAVRPKFNACYQEGKKKNPELAGEIRVTLSFDYKGKITSIKSTGPEDLGKPVVACMVDAVKETPFEFSDSCASKAIVVGKRFGMK